MSNFERNLIYKCYSEDGTYIETLTDVISDLSIEKTINGGDGDFSFELSRKMDDFDEDVSIKFNNRVKVYLKDSYNLAGTKLVAYGYIVSYRPYLAGKKEGIEVTCLSAVSKLSNDFYRLGTALAASDLGVELLAQRADEMMAAIVTHYRTVETNLMINAPAGLTATTDNSGNPITFDNRFFNMKHLDALREASKFLPRNKTAGYWFYWRINTVGDLVVKNVSAIAEHTFLISKHVKEISGQKTIEGVINRVYFWNEKGTVDPDYLKMTVDDTTSQTNYDVIADYITDSKITNTNAATLLSESRVYDKKDPSVQVTVALNGEYDLASIEPGQTCQILNLKNNPYKFGSDAVLVIHSIKYGVDHATLELSKAADNFEDIVEEERQRLDKEMTWYGYITQQLTAAQLGPANRTWSTDIIFTATTGGNAYRQVDWTAGTVYLPTSSGSAAGKRVIVAGNTGLMTPATDYYIYLDEETFNISASTVVSGTGIVKLGGDVLGDSSKSWSNDQYKGYIVTIGGQTKIIRSNTATVLTIEDRWTIADTTGAYTIKKMTFDVSSNKETVSSLTNIVFSSARASASATSEATFTTSGPDPNLNIDGNQIAKDSITVDEIYSGYIYAGTIDADQINVGILTGFIIQTATSGLRMKLHYVAADFAGYLDFLTSNTLLARFSSVALFPSGGGMELELIEANRISGETNELSMSWSGSSLYPGNAWFRLRNKYCGLYYNNSTSTTSFYNDAKYANSILPDISTLDIGGSSDKWRNLYLSGNITVDGTVDGIDIATHAGNVNAHHAQSHSHGSHTGIGVSDHHSSTSNALAITPSSVIVAGVCQPSADNSYDLGATPSNYWRNFYLQNNMYINNDVYPNSDNSSSALGFSTRYFLQLFANYVRYKDLAAFETHDDIALIKNIKKRTVTNQNIKELDIKRNHIKSKNMTKEIWDEKSMPPEVYQNGFYDAGAVQGLTIGTLKQIIDRVEKLEQKVGLK